MKKPAQALNAREVDRLLRRYLGNGVRVDVNPLATTLSFYHPGMGTVTVEATPDGLVIHEPKDTGGPTP
jgi:hypothetical protein